MGVDPLSVRLYYLVIFLEVQGKHMENPLLNQSGATTYLNPELSMWALLEITVKHAVLP